MDINEFADLSRRQAALAQETGLCVECKQPGLAKCYSDAGRKEFTISGLCEKCFDDAFDDDWELLDGGDDDYTNL